MYVAETGNYQAESDESGWFQRKFFDFLNFKTFKAFSFFSRSERKNPCSAQFNCHEDSFRYKFEEI